MGLHAAHLHIDNSRGLEIGHYAVRIQEFMGQHPDRPLDFTDNVRRRKEMVRAVPQLAGFFQGPLMELVVARSDHSRWLCVFDKWLTYAAEADLAALAGKLDTVLVRTVLADSDTLELFFTDGALRGHIKNGLYDPNALAYDYANMTTEEVMNAPHIEGPHQEVRECEIPAGLRDKLGLDGSKYETLLEELNSKEKPVLREDMLYTVCELLGFDLAAVGYDQNHLNELEQNLAFDAQCGLALHHIELETIVED